MGQQRSELADYVNMKVGKDVDMMDFWSENRAVLPQFFKVACRILCVPASSSASERVISTADRLLEKWQTDLSHDSTNSFLFLHSNVQKL